ncbi:MAG: type II toxin-antitoxin system HicA family toxin [Kiritimatiellia bacterium]
MSKKEKLLIRFLAKPCPKDFSWAELEILMRHFNYNELSGSGSRRKFIHPGTKHIISLHKRHPDDTLLEYQIKGVKESLEQQGII